MAGAGGVQGGDVLGIGATVDTCVGEGSTGFTADASDEPKPDVEVFGLIEGGLD